MVDTSQQQINPALESLKDIMSAVYAINPLSGRLVLIYPHQSQTLRDLADLCMDTLAQVTGKETIRIEDNDPPEGFELRKEDNPYTVAVGGDSKLYFAGMGSKNREFWDVTALAPAQWASVVSEEISNSSAVILKA